MGESITEATVSKWLKDKGEKVAADEPIVELETDKVNVEVPAPSNGVLESISVNEGETVNVGALLGVINGAAAQITNDEEDVKDYSPPKKKQVKKATKKLENIIKRQLTFILDLGMKLIFQLGLQILTYMKKNMIKLLLQ